jgi:predicted PP-loop superfamily ATPase
VLVPRRVKDFIDISEYTSLDDLIRYLEAIRANLPPDHQAELKIRGDEVFGRRLTITYFREQTPEELELEARYSGGNKDSATIEDLRRKLDEVPYKIGKAKKG